LAAMSRADRLQFLLGFDDRRLGAHVFTFLLRKLGEFIPFDSIDEFVVLRSPNDVVLANGEISVQHFIYISFEGDSSVFDLALGNRKFHTCSQG
jgi:hypothetical protein